MNAERRKRLDKAETLLMEAKAIIEECLAEESDYLDNMPEGLANGEKGSKAQECCDAMEATLEALDEFDVELLKGTES